MLDLYPRLRVLCPTLDFSPFSPVCRLVDQGAGPEIRDWNESLAGRPQPTEAELLAVDLLPQAKLARIAAVLARTEVLLAQGFVYRGLTFSLAREVQPTWLGLVLAKDLLTYPKGIGAVDGQLLELASASEVLTFWATGLARADALISAQATLVSQIRAARTQAELDQIQDTRT